MKKLAIILAVLMLIPVSTYAAPNDVAVEVKSLTVLGQAKKVNVVTVNLNSADISLEVATANNRVQGAEPFSSIISRTGATVAINGNFFGAYDSLEPYGSIIRNKKLTSLEGTTTSLVVKEGNKVEIDRLTTTIQGYLDGKTQNQWNNVTNKMDFNIFNIWYVNSIPTDNTGVYLYTPERGASIWLNNGTVVEVENNAVSKIVKNPNNQVNIPKNGYLIFYAEHAADDQYVADRFRIGRTITFNYTGISESEKYAQTTEPLSAKQTKLFGSLDKKTKNNWNNAKNDMDFNLFNIWFINSNPVDSSGVYLYTPEKGNTTVPVGHTVEVTKGVVTNVKLNTTSVNIPANGYVIYYGKDSVVEKYVTDRFYTGRTVDFYNENTLQLDTATIINTAVNNNRSALAKSAQLIDMNAVEHMISAGPFLVKDGQKVNIANQGFIEDKITVNRAQRSAIGITKDNKLKLVTGSNLNTAELAQVMIQLGCDRAMNLDGGASSALYANGKTITTPGRNLNTVLVIKNTPKQ